MNEPKAQNGQDQGIQDEVQIELVKEAGTSQFRRTIIASSPHAAVNGLAILILETAKILGVDLQRMLSILAVLLLAPRAKGNEENAETQ